MKNVLFLSSLLLLSVTSLLAADLPEADKQYLASYEKVRTALSSDDLALAKTAAAGLGDSGKDVAKSSSLEAARAGFGVVSEKAAKLAAGQSGYYVVHCPMANKDWVQTSKTISNPYFGKAMPDCGEIKK
jgi:Cu(I)/Ag(I) efflux system membrane fusion protein